MRLPALIALAAAPLVLAACASAGETATAAPFTVADTSPGYAAELDRMANLCAGQGGVLTPSGRHTGEVERDSTCRTNGYVVVYQ
jgi:predicted secreted protein